MPIVIVIVVIVAVAFIVVVLGRILIISLTFGTLAAIGGVVALEISSRIEARKLVAAENGAGQVQTGLVLQIDLVHGSISCTRDIPRLNDVARNLLQQSQILTVACASAVALYVIPTLIFLTLYSDHWLLHWFDHDFSPGWSTMSVVVALLFVAPAIIGGSLYAGYRYTAPNAFIDAVMARAAVIESKFRLAVSPQIKEIPSLIGEIERAAAWTGFVFPTRIASIVEQLKSDILRNPHQLNELVEKTCDQCRADLAHLHESKALKMQAMRALDEAKREVLRTGSSILLSRLEPAHEAIESTELLGLIPDRRWADFHEIVTAMTADIIAVMEDAQRFNASDAGKPPSDDRTPTTLDQAYRTLGIPPTASDDQVKRVWRTLAAAWHPDAGAVTDDTRFKVLSHAYEQIRQARRFV